MSSKPAQQHADDWLEVLLTHCTKPFPKIRIKTKHLKQTAASRFIDNRNILLRKENEDSKEVKNLTEEIAIILIEEGRSKAYQFRKYCDQGNTLNITEMWRMKKRMWPKKKNALPVAKKNHKGKFVSAPADLRKEYKERLCPRPLHPKLKIAKRLREKVIRMKLKSAKNTLSDPFKMKDLEEVLTNIKSGKSRDPKGISREIFKLNNIGTDLKKSLLTLCNKVKQNGIIPNFMRETIISTIPKKGPRSELKN